MNETDLFNKLSLLRLPGVGPVKFKQYVQQYGTIVDAIKSLDVSVQHLDNVKREMALADKLNIQYISDDSPMYPKKLLMVKNHPPILSVRGNINTLAKQSVAMVGTRHATGAGISFMKNLATEFASRGYAVVSGMAIGTDTAAHIGALNSVGDYQTIAVLAGAADYIWPLENERLYNQILDRGIIVSEMPVGSKPVANNFIQRNRWIAGISEKLILGEADEKSGSMATAQFAIDIGRSIYAVPGHPSDSRSFGPNRLIQEQKAILCMGSSDFFEQKNKKAETKNQNLEIDNAVLEKLSNIPMPESVLAELVKKDISEIKRELILLELNKQARKTNGGYVKY